MQTFQEIPLTSEDSELVARFTARGDEKAFTEIVRRHLPLVLAVTRRRLGGSGLAEDAAQQVFIALFRRLKQQREISCLAAWLQKAAVYEAANLARKEDRHRRRVGQAHDLQEANEPANQGRQLDQALASLPERDRQILLLHHFEKLSFAKVATRLGITEAAAQRRGHRALEKLGKFLRSRDSNACSMWLAASFAPAETPVSSDLVAKVAAVKNVAALGPRWKSSGPHTRPSRRWLRSLHPSCANGRAPVLSPRERRMRICATTCVSSFPRRRWIPMRPGNG
jgi:RNA polymerase sigma factor (sigma-70 family)